MQTQKIYRLPELMAIVGLRRSTIYARMAEGTFPQAVQLGPRSVGWTDSSVQEFLGQLVQRSAPTKVQSGTRTA